MRLGRMGLDPALCASRLVTIADRSKLVSTRRPPEARRTSSAAVSASSLMTSTPASSSAAAAPAPALPPAGEVSLRGRARASASRSSVTRQASPRSPSPTHSCQRRAFRSGRLSHDRARYEPGGGQLCRWGPCRACGYAKRTR